MSSNLSIVLSCQMSVMTSAFSLVDNFEFDTISVFCQSVAFCPQRFNYRWYDSRLTTVKTPVSFPVWMFASLSNVFTIEL